MKIERSQKEIENNKSKIVVLKKEINLIEERADLNKTIDLNNIKKEIQFLESKYYYSYIAETKVIGVFKGKLVSGKSIKIELSRSITKINFKEYSVPIAKRNFDIFYSLMTVSQDESNNFVLDNREDLMPLDNNSLVEYQNKIKLVLLLDLTLIEFLINNYKKLNNQGLYKLKNISIFENLKENEYEKVWSAQKIKFTFKPDEYIVSDKETLDEWKKRYFIAEESDQVKE